MKCYFAHPMATYGSEREKMAIQTIDRYFQSETYRLINPNGDMHQQAYDIIGFKYFLTLVSSCDTLIAMSHFDGRFGNGSYQEIMAAVDAGLALYEVKPVNGEWIIEPLKYKEIAPLSIEETKWYRKNMRG